jgi:hypothetical protein
MTNLKKISELEGAMLAFFTYSALKFGIYGFKSLN